MSLPIIEPRHYYRSIHVAYPVDARLGFKKTNERLAEGYTSLPIHTALHIVLQEDLFGQSQVSRLQVVFNEFLDDALSQTVSSYEAYFQSSLDIISVCPGVYNLLDPRVFFVLYKS